MSQKDFEMPIPINQKSLQNVKVFADRESFLINKPEINSYIEIGVFAGEYTDLVIKHLKPKSITLVDTFNLDDVFQLENPRFNKKNHYDFIKNKYNDPKFQILQSPFEYKDNKKVLGNKQYDYIYIDAEHSLDFMSQALNFATNHLNKNGMIGINDYLIFDHITDEYYGVVQSVNKLLFINPEWSVKSYVIGSCMHSDIYIGRTFENSTLH